MKLQFDFKSASSLRAWKGGLKKLVKHWVGFRMFCATPMSWLLPCLMVQVGAAALAESKPSRLNVLFIAVDDLNHWVGHLARE